MNIIKKIRQIVPGVVLLSAMAFGVIAAPLAPTAVYADPGSEITKGVNAVDDGATSGDLAGLIKNVINILLFIVGAAAVIMIIIGGLRYVTSGGDSSSVTAAKNTILYSVVGLVVASLAFAIVNFIVDKL